MDNGTRIIEDHGTDEPAARGQLDGRVAGAVYALLGLAAVALFLVWTDHDGGYAPEQWLPGGLLVLALLAAASAAPDARARLAAAWLPVTLLAAYAAFSYASIAWAGARGDAVDGANRTALYAAVFALFVALPRGILRLAVPACWAAGVVVLGLVHFLQAASASGPRGFFILGRLAAPLTYPDAEAAVLLMAAATLAVLAARRVEPLWVRAAAAGLACAGAELAVAAQSRGSVAALPLAVVLLVVLSRNALRTLLTLAVLGVAVAAAAPRLLAVYTAVVTGDGYPGTLGRARTALVVTSLLAAAAVAGIALLERRVTVPARVSRLIGRSLLAGALFAVAAAVAVAFVVGDPVHRARTAWTNFTSNASAPPETIHLASGVGTSRYDVWRIAVHQFTAHPVGGVGSDNYLAGYLRDRRTVETARFPESMVLRVFSETGLLGAALFFGFLATAATAAFRTLRREPPLGQTLVGLAATGYWAFHASVDWFWEFPALTAPALAFLGLACTLPVRAPGRGARQAALRRAARPAAVLAGAAGAAALLCTWVAVRKVDAAVAAPSAGQAYRLLDSAARWNPLSEQPQLTEAAIAANALDRRRERAALHAALRKNPDDWYARLMLGIVAGRLGDRKLAAAELARARALSPLEPVVIYAQNNLRVGNALSEREIAAVFELRSRTLRGVDQR